MTVCPQRGSVKWNIPNLKTPQQVYPFGIRMLAPGNWFWKCEELFETRFRGGCQQAGVTFCSNKETIVPFDKLEYPLFK